MFDSFYITNSQKYVFNKETGLMFKVSSNMAKVLCKFQGENDLKEKDPSLFTEIEPYLIKLKQDIALSAIESKQNSISLQLIMCTMCNLSCKYCYAHAGTYNQEQAKMSLNVVKKALDIFLSKYDFIDVLTFFGGEPLLCIDEIEKICEYIDTKIQ